MRIVLILLSMLALAGCGSSDSGNNISVPVTSQTATPKVPPPAGKKWEQVVSKTAEGGYLMGNPNAPVKLLEYGSRGCPVCGAFANSGMRPLIDNYVDGGQVSYEFREFWVHGAPDVAASLLGQCVGTDAFFPVLEQMYANQPVFNEKLGKLTQQDQERLQALPATQMPAAMAEAAGYLDFIKQRGVPEPKARQCLGDKKLLDALVAINKYGQDQMKVQGTPTFFINGSQVENTVTWDALETALKAAGAR